MTLAQLKVLKLENRWWKVHLVPVLFEKRGNDRKRPFKSDECKTLDWERPLRASQAGYVHSSQSREKLLFDSVRICVFFGISCVLFWNLCSVRFHVGFAYCFFFTADCLICFTWSKFTCVFKPHPLPLFARLSLLPIQARSHYMSDCFFCQKLSADCLTLPTGFHHCCFWIKELVHGLGLCTCVSFLPTAFGPSCLEPSQTGCLKTKVTLWLTTNQSLKNK